MCFDLSYSESLKLQFISGILFILLGSSFGVSGLLINRRLGVYFQEFYDDNKCVLWVACFGLSVPLIARGILDLARALNKDFDLFILYNIAIYSPSFYVLTDLIPLLFQLSSLIFGYIRNKQEKQFRKNERQGEEGMPDMRSGITYTCSDTTFFDPPLLFQTSQHPS